MTDIRVKQCLYTYLHIEEKTLICVSCNKAFVGDEHVIIPQVDIWCGNSIWILADWFYHRHCFYRELRLIAYMKETPHVQMDHCPG